MKKQRLCISVNKVLLELVDEARAKLPYDVARSVMFERSMAYYLGCLEDFVHKKGKFKIDKNDNLRVSK